MSILSVDNIQPIGSGTSVTVNSAATLFLTNANSTGVVTATTFVGNLTGNPTGTLQTAAQPNITSVGTLSALTVSGNINVSSTDPTIVFVDSDNNPDFDIKAGGGRFAIRDSTNNAERLRINSNGQIGIGENNPTRDIVIKKSGSVQVSMVGATNQNVFLNFGDTDDDNIGGINYDNTNNRLRFRANTNDAVQVKSNGNMAINDGDLEIGTSGHGISFAATGDASGMSNELLDDYEEGSFTATLSASGGGATFASGHIQTACLYVKIGGMVHVQGYFSGTNVTGGGTGIVKVSGLPFASNNTTYYTICLTHNTMTAQQCTGAYIQYANTYFFPIQTGSTSGSAFNVGNPRYLMFGGSYPVQF